MDHTRRRKNAFLAQRLESVPEAVDLEATVGLLEALLGEGRR
jgi:hypothetical protein